MEMETLKDIATVLAALLSVGAVLYGALTYRYKANASSIEELRQKDIEHDIRLTKIESALGATSAAIPELRREVGDVHRRVDDVAGTVNRIAGVVEGVDKNTRMINEHLLKESEEGRR